ncbi:MAG: hypothetical protein R3C68_03830 [Myxococcota bacterium]
MTRRRTRGEAAIDAQLAALEEGSPRHAILVSARDFKVAWIEFGEKLTKVREKGLYKQWGHATFETYCRRELHIKSDTANKLTRSFAFLRDHEPGALTHRQERELPPLDVVDLLSRAPERSRISDEQLTTIREEVFADGVTPTRNQVVKRFRDFDPDAFRAPRGASPQGEGDTRKALLLAERLLSLLEAQEGISRQTLDGVRQATTELRELFEASQFKESA